MRKKRHTPEQIITKPRQIEVGWRIAMVAGLAAGGARLYMVSPEIFRSSWIDRCPLLPLGDRWSASEPGWVAAVPAATVSVGWPAASRSLVATLTFLQTTTSSPCQSGSAGRN